MAYNVQGYPPSFASTGFGKVKPAGFVSGICACAAFFKYKDFIVRAVIPAGG